MDRGAWQAIIHGVALSWTNRTTKAQKTTIYTKQITSKDLLPSTGDYIQYFVTTYKNLKIYQYLSHI